MTSAYKASFFPSLPSSSGAPKPSNPFPGLRPFGAGEASLFFGRAQHVETLLAKLQRQRLLAVVGTSGSGKSSLVLAGILPRLDRGYRTPTGSSWREVTMRPGSDPIANLATALQAARELDDEEAYDALNSAAEEASGQRTKRPGSELERDLLRTELERSSCGLLEAVRSLGLCPGENLLLVVDQFEEIFRFHRLLQGQAHDVAAAFVKLLLTACEQHELPIYVMLTLRSDFLGECVQFPGLAEAISEGQYLVPLLNRDQRAEVIRGPVGVAGATISTALVQRLLNDAGDMTDQLPVLQHAMMRTFELAQLAERPEALVRLELSHYEAAGQMRFALSQHADQAYAEVGREFGAPAQRVCERLFRCLTDGGEHGGGVRRPCRVAEVLAVAGCDLPTLKAVVARFVGQGRGFLVQQPAAEFTLETTLDISHESLMRNWETLKKWSGSEMALAQQLQALSEAERDYAAGTRSLLRDPELSLALKWQREQNPTAAAAQRYGVNLDRVNAFLAKSAAVARRRVIVLWTSIGAVFLGLSLLAFQLHHSRQLARRSASEATIARVKAEAAETEAKRALAAARTATLVRLAQDTEAEPARSASYLRETRHSAADRGAVWHRLAASAAQRRLSFQLEGHARELESAAFSADGKRIVTASQDGTARVWDSDSGQLLSKLEDNMEVVRSASFSANGRWIATTSWDKTARIWDSASGRSIATLVGHTGELYSAAFSRDGQRIVTASADGTARIWDANTGRSSVNLLGHTGLIYAAEFSADGSRVVTAGEDGAARLWNATTGELLHVLAGHTASLAVATFSADGRKVVTASADKTARVWDGLSGELLATLEGHKDRVGAASFTTGDRVITASWDGTARVWSAVTGELLAELKGQQGIVHSAVFSADGRRIVTVADDSAAWVWDGQTGDGGTHSAHVNIAAFSPNGERVVTASSDRTARIWEAETRRLIATLKGHTAPVQIAAFSEDGRQVLTVGADNTVRTWDASNGRSIAVLAGHRAGINSVSFSADGSRVVTGSWDQSAVVWDSTSGQVLAKLQGHLDGVSDVSFNKDAGRVVSASWDGTAKIWDTATGRCLLTLKGPKVPVHAALFSPTGDRVATTLDNGTAAIWDAITGALLHSLAGHTGIVRTAVFSADGSTIITSADDGTARVWDTHTGALQHVLTGHTAAVVDVAISGDQRWVATASLDKTARVWERSSGKLVGVMQGHMGAVSTAMFTSDSTKLATSSADESAGWWNLNGDALHFLGNGGAARRAVVRQRDGRPVAEVWDETSRSWIDARTVFWRDFGLCLSKEERMESLSESAEQAARNSQSCRQTAAACQNSTLAACEQILAHDPDAI